MKNCSNCIWNDKCEEEELCDNYYNDSVLEQEYNAVLKERTSYYDEIAKEME